MALLLKKTCFARLKHDAFGCMVAGERRLYLFPTKPSSEILTITNL